MYSNEDIINMGNHYMVMCFVSTININHTIDDIDWLGFFIIHNTTTRQYNTRMDFIGFQ